jgi:hypothetical protein
MLDQHYFCVSDVVEDTSDEDDEVSITTPSPAKKEKDEALDSIFAGIKESAEIPEKKPEAPSTPSSSVSEDDTDVKLKELLAGL